MINKFRILFPQFQPVPLFEKKNGPVISSTLLIFLTVASLLFLPELSSKLQWIRSDWLNIFKIFGCHLTHWSSNHCFWDLFVFVCLSLQLEKTEKHYWFFIALSSLFISFSLLLFIPADIPYRGLSGIDSALFGLLLMRLLKSKSTFAFPHQGISFLLASLFLGKIFYEISTKKCLLVSSTASMSIIPIPEAHLTGFLFGIFFGFVQISISNKIATEKTEINTIHPNNPKS